MKQLSNNWIVEPALDFEYKKYILLDYLQGVGRNFARMRLFPHLDHLRTHLRNVIQFRNKKLSFQKQVPREIEKIEWQKLQLKYKHFASESEVLYEVDSIVSYSIPKFEQFISEGKEIKRAIVQQTHISSVGVMPIQKDNGYLMLSDKKMIRVYFYRRHLVKNASNLASHHALTTQFVYKTPRGINNQYEQIKVRLIQEFPDLPNPATYAIETELDIPCVETFMPIAKQLLLQQISA